MRFASKIKRLKNDILGKEYSLSMAFVSENKSREINKKYRKVDRATNVLSFPLRKGEGELVFCKEVIKREVAEKNKSPHRRSAGEAETFEEWLLFLVIHGMLHLKGLKHSATMEKREEYYDKKYFGRDRRGVFHHQSGSGRIRQGRKKS